MKSEWRIVLSMLGMVLLGTSTTLLADSNCKADGTNCYGNVAAYGNVKIADDSVQSWGPWNEFAQPAAGPAPVNSPLMSALPSGPILFSDSSDFVPTFEVPVEVIPSEPSDPTYDRCLDCAY